MSDPFDLVEVLAENIVRFQASDPAIDNDGKIAARSKGEISKSSVQRWRTKESKPTLDNVASLARAMGVLPWQLLVPGVDPKNPPHISIVAEERELYARLERAKAILMKGEE